MKWATAAHKVGFFCLLWLVQRPLKSMGGFSINFQVHWDQTYTEAQSGSLCPKQTECMWHIHSRIWCRRYGHLHRQWNEIHHLSLPQFSFLTGTRCLAWWCALSHVSWKLSLGINFNQHHPGGFKQKDNLLQLRDGSYAITVMCWRKWKQNWSHIIIQRGNVLRNPTWI